MTDVLSRITYFRMKRGWTEYQLAEKAGLTQSTISSWYRKNMIPSIPSLELCCELTEVQKSLIEEMSRLSREQQTALVSFLKTL